MRRPNWTTRSLPAKWIRGSITLIFLHLFLFSAVCEEPTRPQTGSAGADTSNDEQSNAGLGRKGKYESLFNCVCPDDCGKNLANCTCSFSDKMRRQLISLDMQNTPRARQMEIMRKKYGKEVLAVPEQSGPEYYLAYLVPPAILFLGLLFVGSLGWYWVQKGRKEPESTDVDVESNSIREEIEREIEDEQSE